MDAHITRFCNMFPSADPAVVSAILESSFPPPWRSSYDDRAIAMLVEITGSAPVMQQRPEHALHQAASDNERHRRAAEMTSRLEAEEWRRAEEAVQKAEAEEVERQRVAAERQRMADRLAQEGIAEERRRQTQEAEAARQRERANEIAIQRQREIEEMLAQQETIRKANERSEREALLKAEESRREEQRRAEEARKKAEMDAAERKLQEEAVAAQRRARDEAQENWRLEKARKKEAAAEAKRKADEENAKKPGLLSWLFGGSGSSTPPPPQENTNPPAAAHDSKSTSVANPTTPSEVGLGWEVVPNPNKPHPATARIPAPPEPRLIPGCEDITFGDTDTSPATRDDFSRMLNHFVKDIKPPTEDPARDDEYGDYLRPRNREATTKILAEANQLDFHRMLAQAMQKELSHSESFPPKEASRESTEDDFRRMLDGALRKELQPPAAVEEPISSPPPSALPRQSSEGFEPESRGGGSADFEKLFAGFLNKV